MIKNERGITLLEVIVAMVILALIVMYMGLVPFMSQGALKSASQSARANTAIKDKIEEFRNYNAMTRLDTIASGYDYILNRYGTVWNRDTIKISGMWFAREFRITPSDIDTQYPNGTIARVDIFAYPIYQGQPIKGDTIRSSFSFARRDAVRGWK